MKFLMRAMALLSLLIPVLCIFATLRPLAQGIKEPWLDQENVADENAPPFEGGSMPNSQKMGPPKLHEIHLGYDKDSGRTLDDPTSTALDMEKGAPELRWLSQEKMENINRLGDVNSDRTIPRSVDLDLGGAHWPSMFDDL